MGYRPAKSNSTTTNTTTSSTITEKKQPINAWWTHITEGVLHTTIRRFVVALATHAAGRPEVWIISVIFWSFAIVATGFFTNFRMELDQMAFLTPQGSLPDQHSDWIFGEESGFEKLRVLWLAVHTNGDNVVFAQAMRQAITVMDMIQTEIPDYHTVCSQSQFLDFDTNEPTCRVFSVTHFWHDNITFFEKELAALPLTTHESEDEYIQRVISNTVYPDGTPVFHEAILGNYEFVTIDDEDLMHATTTNNENTTTTTSNITKGSPLLPPSEKWIITNAQALVFKIDIPDLGEETDELELQLLDKLADMKANWLESDAMATVELEYFTFNAYQSEFQRAIDTDLPLVVVLVLVMISFTCLVFYRPKEKVQSRALLGGYAFATIGCSILTGYGIMFLFGVPLTNIGIMIPFVVVGVALDDTFIITGAYFRIKRDNPTANHITVIQETMEETAVSITMTTITTLICFLSGVASSIPAVKWLCLYAATTIACDFFYQITFFIAFLTLDERRVKANRKDLCFWIVVKDGNDDDDDDDDDDEIDNVEIEGGNDKETCDQIQPKEVSINAASNAPITESECTTEEPVQTFSDEPTTEGGDMETANNEESKTDAECPTEDPVSPILSDETATEDDAEATVIEETVQRASNELATKPACTKEEFLEIFCNEPRILDNSSATVEPVKDEAPSARTFVEELFFWTGGTDAEVHDENIPEIVQTVSSDDEPTAVSDGIGDAPSGAVATSSKQLTAVQEIAREPSSALETPFEMMLTAVPEQPSLATTATTTAAVPEQPTSVATPTPTPARWKPAPAPPALAKTRKSPKQAVANKDSELEQRTFMEQSMGWYANQLLRPWTKCFVMFAFSVYLAGCSYSTTLLYQEFNVGDYVPKDSYLTSFMTVFQQYTTVQRYIGIYFRDVDQSSPVIQQHMTDYVQELSALPQISEDPAFFWVRDFPELAESEQAAELGINFDGLTFNEQVDLALNVPQVRQIYAQDIVRDEVSGNITASRTYLNLRYINMYEVTNQVDMLMDQRRISRSQPINDPKFGNDMAFFTFDDLYYFWELYAIVVDELIFTTVTCVAVVSVISFIMIPHWSAVAFVTPLIIFLYICLLGTMQFCGVKINSVTYFIIVMAIGLLVDFLMHIMLRYYESKGRTRHEKVKETLETMGASILLGGFTTWLGVIPLAFSTTKIFMTVFISFWAMVTLGCAVGLILLPVLLSIWGPENMEANVKSSGAHPVTTQE